VPYDCDGMRRWESFLFITRALRAYVARKPLPVRTEPAWPRVIALASQHLVSPAIGIVLLHERSIPNGVRDYFAAVIALNQERNRRLEAAIREAIEALNRPGITPLLLKGAANLLEGLYHDPAARIMGDIDMLVPAERVKEASAVLASIGYDAAAPMASQRKRWILMKPHPHHAPMQIHVKSGAGIELHHELVHRGSSRLINARDALAHAAPRERDGLRYLLLCQNDRVTHNIVHAQLHHSRQRLGLVDLRQMFDLALLIEQRGDLVGWREIEARFALAAAAQVLGDQIALLNALFGCRIPLAAQSPGRALARLRRAIAEGPGRIAVLQEIAAYYWAAFCRQPLLAINFLNPLWWPQRIKGWQRQF
jgi:Uncharacterised nucleotidyltransferase